MNRVPTRRQRVVSSATNGSVQFSNPLLQMARDTIHQAYDRIDVKRDGYVSVTELHNYLVDDLMLEESVAKDVCASIDKDGNGTIDQEEFMQLFEKELYALDNQATQEAPASPEDTSRSKGPLQPQAPTSLYISFLILVKRSYVQKIRQQGTVMLNLTMMMISGLVVGMLLGSDHEPYKLEDTKTTLMMTLIMTIIMTLSGVSSLNLFGFDHVMIQREKYSGVPILAFYVSKCLVDLVENVWQPAFFLGICYNMVFPATPFLHMLSSLILISFAGSGVGILVSVIVKAQSMTLVTVLFTLVTGIFINGSIGFTYTMVKEQGMQNLWAMSFPRWGQELLLTMEMDYNNNAAYQELIVHTIVEYYGYFPVWDTKWTGQDTEPEQNKSEQKQSRAAQKKSDWEEYFDTYANRCRVNLFVIGLVLRIVAYVILRYTAAMTEVYKKMSRDILEILLNFVSESRKKAEASVKNLSVILTATRMGRDDDDQHAVTVSPLHAVTVSPL